MLSESARATTAQESRFRIDTPNAAPRRVKVIALDAPSAAAMRRLAGAGGGNATCLTALGGATAGKPVGAGLAGLAGETAGLVEEIASADLVVTLSNAGENAEMAGVVAEACRAQGKTLTALVLDRGHAAEERLLKTLLPLRPHAAMLVVAQDEDYVEAMLTALRA
jgi:hypothetical protein